MRRAKFPVQICLSGPISGSLSEQLSFALNSTYPPTAIFALSNLLAVKALHELQRRSVRIAQTMALIAFDDFDAATLVRPTITVVQQPVAELGRRATELLLTRLGEDAIPGVSRIVLPTKLVTRQSCGCGKRQKRE
jgi:LacI family transcriptional regulator